MKKHFLLNICCVFSAMLCTVPPQTQKPLRTALAAYSVSSGKCGDNLTWELDRNTHTLTISGEGDMYDWTLQQPPNWTQFKDSIHSIDIAEGVSSIGDYAFYRIGADNACRDYSWSAILPESLTRIGKSAFEECEMLGSVRIGDGVTEIGKGAFADCVEMTSVRLPQNLTALSPACFAGCRNLETIHLPEHLTRIPERCFEYCTHLKTVLFPQGLTEICDSAFIYCTYYVLKSLPPNLQTLGANAFDGCMYDTKLEFPPSLDTVGESALPEVLSLVRKDIVTPSGFLYSLNCSGEYPVIPDTVRTIPASALFILRNFETLVIPAYVETIENGFAEAYPSLRTVMGSTGTAAEAFAEANHLEFIPLDSDAGEPVRPDFGRNTLSIGNTSENFGTGYPMNEWHTAVIQEAAGANQIISEPDAEWKGSCFGLAAFQVLLDTGTLSPLRFGAETIADIQPSEDVISYINCLHRTSKLPALTTLITDQTKNTQNQSLLRIAALAQKVNEGDEPFLIQIRTPGNGLHEIAGYGLEAGEWEWDSENYDRRILLWDSNYTEGGDRIQLYYQTKTLHWCIPAYQMHFNGTENEAGALLYTIDHLPQHIQHFAERAVPLPGDVNSDAVLSVSDAVLLSRIITEYDNSYPEKKTGRINLDANGDGFLDSDDILSVLNRLTES